MKLQASEKSLLLKLSRTTLESLYDSNTEKALREFARDSTHLTENLMGIHPCFVTLFELDERLRGCIGTLVTFNSLYKNVHYFTREAALCDPRFDPVQESEIKDLEIHIAVLGPPRPMTDIKKIKIGEQGLNVKFGERRGVLLASVAVDYNWTPEEFLRQTCIKAGLPPERVKEYTVSCFDEISFGEGMD